jgi:hypothetical protein
MMCRFRNAARTILTCYASHRPPPPTPPPSVALLTALGYLQDIRDGEALAVEDLDELADNAGIALVELQPLIAMAEEKGYLSIDDDGSVRLTQKGWRWYETYNPT